MKGLVKYLGKYMNLNVLKLIYTLDFNSRKQNCADAFSLRDWHS